VERVKALGWGEELSLLSNEQQRVENLAVVIEACHNNLTERGMGGIFGALLLTDLNLERSISTRRTRGETLEEDLDTPFES